MEIYTESKHGVMFAAQRDLLNLAAPPNKLTTHDMFVPTCATCHMSGLNGTGVTHDPSERLSYYLFAEVTTPRPDADRAQAKMKDICLQCHTPPLVDRVYRGRRRRGEGDQRESPCRQGHHGWADARTACFRRTLSASRSSSPTSTCGITTAAPPSTAAFMGGADFVQWHGNYPILEHMVEIKERGRSNCARNMREQ